MAYIWKKHNQNTYDVKRLTVFIIILYFWFRTNVEGEKKIVWIATTSKRIPSWKSCRSEARIQPRRKGQAVGKSNTIENGWHDIAFYIVFCCIILCKSMQFFLPHGYPSTSIVCSRFHKYTQLLHYQLWMDERHKETKDGKCYFFGALYSRARVCVWFCLVFIYLFIC